jgi:hypothetical protein
MTKCERCNQGIPHSDCCHGCETLRKQLRDVSLQVERAQKIISLAKAGIRREERGNGHGWWSFVLPQEQMIDLFEALEATERRKEGL